MADTYEGRSAFFANYGSMTMTVASYKNYTDPNGTATVEVAALKGISITPKFEHVTLYVWNGLLELQSQNTHSMSM